MEVPVALPMAVKAIQKGISLLNFGTFQDMTDTEIVVLFSIHKSMVSIYFILKFIIMLINTIMLDFNDAGKKV